MRDTQIAAKPLGVELLVVKAATKEEIDEAFSTMANEGAGAVVIQADAQLAIGQPSEDSAPRQPLQINHPIESVGPQLPNAAPNNPRSTV